MSSAPLTLRRTDVDGTTVLEIHGALRSGNTPALERHLALLLVQLRSPLVIDLAGVQDCDAVGAAVLMGAGRAAAPATPVRLACPGDTIREALRTVGTPSAVPIFASVDGAARSDPSQLLG